MTGAARQPDNSKMPTEAKMHAMKFGNPIFIISPVKRSGTNYLKNVLCQHQDCFSPGPIWEDELLRKAHLLADYADFTFQKWNPKWNVETELMPPQQMLGLMGAGITDMLLAQFSNSAEKRERFCRDFSNQDTPPYRYVTKTPKADNIALLPQLFPDAYLLILVRDGRAAARSGQTSFAKPFDCAVREWAGAMDEISAFIRSPLFNPERHRLLRYEDLVSNPHQQMQELMTFLDLDASRINLSNLDRMPVVGSSTLRSEGRDVHWTPVEKPAGFDPLARAQELSPFKRSHFSYLAAASGRFAGYEVPPPAATLRPFHALRSAAWWPVWHLWRMSHIAREDLPRCLRRLFTRRQARPAASMDTV